MAGLLSVFAEFEREILREPTRAGLAQARLNSKSWVGLQPRPCTLPKSEDYTALVWPKRKSPAAFWLAALQCDAS